MLIEITCGGYRCFSPEAPVVLSLQEGLVAFVGLNNAGKSTILRMLYEFRGIFQSLSSLAGPLVAAIGQSHTFERPAELGDIAEIFWHYGQSDIHFNVALPNDQGVAGVYRADIRVFYGTDRFKVTFHHSHGNTSSGEQINFDNSGNLIVDGGSLGKLDKMFEAFKILSDCFYFPAVRHVTAFAADNVNTRGRYFDIASGKSFVQSWAHRQQGAGKASTQTTRKITNDIRRIFGFHDLEIHADSGLRELLIVADEKSSRLGELGTGLAQFILLLGNIEFAEPSYVLMDEPETSLHPSLQLQFVRSVASRAKCGVLFATHNLGLARQAADRVFAVTSSSGSCRVDELSTYNNLAQLVGEMSFGRADNLGARRLLLVEGTNDILTYEAILAAYDKERDFAILSLGGGGGISQRRRGELEHILAINPAVCAVIDRETDDGGLSEERAAFVEMCKGMGIRCYVLKRRAIENYFSENAISVAFPRHTYRALSANEKRGLQGQTWPKRDNWRIVQQMTRAELDATDLKEFIEFILDDNAEIKSSTADPA